MSMPRFVRVGPRRLAITRSARNLYAANESRQPELSASRCELDPEPRTRRIVGRYWGRLGRIDIDPELPNDAAREVLVHELGHALWDQAGFADVPGLARHEEHVVNALACGWLDTLRRNKALARYLTE